MTSALRLSASISPSISPGSPSSMAPARGKAMRGGFTFKLSSKWWRPTIQVRHLNARASLMQFTHPPKRRDPRGHRKRKIAPRQRRGSFIDLKTIAAALLSRSFYARFARRLPEDANPQGRKRRPWQAVDGEISSLRHSGRSGRLGNATRPCAIDTHCMRLRKRRWAKSSAKQALARHI